MNVSSIIIKIDWNHYENVISELGLLEGIEVHICDEATASIIVSITAVDVSGEIARLKDIEKITGVLSANMHYSYSEEELEKNISTQKMLENIEKSQDAKEIRYKGNVGSWLPE
ncbi:hypothetical protein BJI48_02590 [Helicobacter sp. 11S02596-1]|nr:hypothetical protein BJI48_02590 [Helicobacter sp. 11S02596-1]